ncbi:MAG: hypothetical protein QOG13_1568 [Sphingomonadales bacterium]|jgi:SAM-dependent methyltransferase|nr:hypothetical protein [Sphingomonadales bacterium]
MSIYVRAVGALEEEGVLAKTDRILVSCGGETDARSLKTCGMTNVLIGNLDDGSRQRVGDYDWQYCDAEKLPFEDGSFDWGFIHAGLHHCRSPHLGLLELLRVSRKGVLVIEARDSLLMRAAVRCGMAPQYEIEAVALHPGEGGGLRNSGVPNFIYRWTEREVRKTVESAHPDSENQFRFYYGLALPEERVTMAGPMKRAFYRIASLAARALVALVPSQGNQFAFAILKTGRNKAWIKRDAAGARLDPDYRLAFDASKYVREEVDPL